MSITLNRKPESRVKSRRSRESSSSPSSSKGKVLASKVKRFFWQEILDAASFSCLGLFPQRQESKMCFRNYQESACRSRKQLTGADFCRSRSHQILLGQGEIFVGAAAAEQNNLFASVTFSLSLSLFPALSILVVLLTVWKGLLVLFLKIRTIGTYNMCWTFWDFGNDTQNTLAYSFEISPSAISLEIISSSHIKSSRGNESGTTRSSAESMSSLQESVLVSLKVIHLLLQDVQTISWMCRRFTILYTHYDFWIHILAKQCANQHASTSSSKNEGRSHGSCLDDYWGENASTWSNTLMISEICLYLNLYLE